MHFVEKNNACFQIAVFIVSVIILVETIGHKKLNKFGGTLHIVALLGFFWTVISFIMGMF